ncbi:hypothetical protein B0J17DRAFT_721510 [Rhizoctonia solani]|nr:hypothetical protein B0J17DRAFT_721510 [Rhizoctonia solani]
MHLPWTLDAMYFILWIVSPLNFIENQQAKQFRKWGLKAVTVNSTTLTPDLLKEIKAGKYQVVISSPEAYQDVNKLRRILLSPKFANRKHVTAIDECDMRVFMSDPENAPVIAMTATASDPVKADTSFIEVPPRSSPGKPWKLSTQPPIRGIPNV